MKKLSLLLLVLAAFVTANAQPYLVGHLKYRVMQQLSKV